VTRRVRRRRQLRGWAAGAAVVAVVLNAVVAIPGMEIPRDQVQAQAPVIQGSGTATVDPGGSVVFGQPLPNLEGSTRPAVVPLPPSRVTATNHSDQTAEAGLGGGGVQVRVPLGNAILATAGEAWRQCKYGTDLTTSASAAPANAVVCLYAGGALPILDFTTIPWDAASPMTLQVAYAGGWNLVGVPSETTLSGFDPQGRSTGPVGPLLTSQPAGGGYQSAPAGTNFQPGLGYWAYFAAPTTVSLASSGPQSLSATIPPGQYVMVGNPGQAAVTISGADAIYTYDTTGNTYVATSTLDPGQGALVYSARGGAITIAPVVVPVPPRP